MSNIKKIQKTLRGRLRENVSLKDYNTWKVGGKAEYFYEPIDLEDLKLFLELLDNTPIILLGNGSNVLIRDGGIEGCVICLKKTLNNYSFKDEEYIFEAGLSCMKMAQITARENYAGLEFLCGIPGSLGGALAMNAGAFGSETWPFVTQVEMINRQGELKNRLPEEFEINYRWVSQFDNEWFAAAKFQFNTQTKNQNSNIKQLLRQRNASQPIGLPSCGSVFKNPQGHHAAQLIEAAGLKGYYHGQACVSNKHANFIISNEQTSAKDIENLVAFIQDMVKQKFNVTLETEMRILGDEL